MTGSQRLSALEGLAFSYAGAGVLLPNFGLLMVYPRPYDPKDQRAWKYVFRGEEIDAETAGRMLLVWGP